MLIGIIGGGASGMAAAIAASNNPEVEVVIFERQSRLGRKLLATGNGRCNLTNLKADEMHYFGENPSFAKAALTAMGPDKTLDWFRSLGLLTVSEPSGRVYPYSDQANSVLDVLRFALERPNVTLRLGFEVTKATQKDGGFLVSSSDDSVFCDRLIIACGGLAGTKLGGTMSGYKLLASFGHKFTKLRPALVQLKSGWNGIASLKGVRAQCDAKITCNGVLYAQSSGEIQFTEYGISGPVVFEISRDVCQTKDEWLCILDFLPQYSQDELLSILSTKNDMLLDADKLLVGILHNRLGSVLLKSAGVRPNHGKLSQTQLKDISYVVKNFEISLTEPLGMDSAQVTAGGVLTKDFCEETMQSRLVPALYACGEVLDIDGACGGYNLQWAWSSGYCAGHHAAERTLNND